MVFQPDPVTGFIFFCGIEFHDKIYRFTEGHGTDAEHCLNVYDTDSPDFHQMANPFRAGSDQTLIRDPADIHNIIRDKLVSAFHKFKSGFTFDPVSKKQFAELVKTAKFEGYYEGAKAAFDSLESKLNHDVAFALDRNEKVVRQILESDIIAAYYYQAGAIEAGLNYDNQLKEAVRLLKNPEEYKKVLAPQKTKETSSLIRLEKKPVGNITAKRQEPLIFSAIA